MRYPTAARIPLVLLSKQIKERCRYDERNHGRSNGTMTIGKNNTDVGSYEESVLLKGNLHFDHGLRPTPPRTHLTGRSNAETTFYRRRCSLMWNLPETLSWVVTMSQTK